MDKRPLSYFLLEDIENDNFFQQAYNALLVDYSRFVISQKMVEYSNQYKSLLRYADMLSLSDKEFQQNMAQHIAILLSALFPNESEIEFFKRHIYKNVSNFVSANMLENHRSAPLGEFDFLRNIEIETHKIGNKIPETDKHYFDSQRIALRNIENNQYYSFSAPTSMGKTFIVTNFIHNKIRNGSKDNFIIIVPTRALLSEIANKIINDFSDILGVRKHKVVTAIASVRNDENFIAVLTPERAYYALLKKPEINYNYVFIDEAHKISDKDKRSIIYYKVLDMLKMRKDVHIYFSSPVIPNPDIYLELTDYFADTSNHANGQVFEFSPVIQNKFYIDFNNRSYGIINSFRKLYLNCGNFSNSITDKLSALILIGQHKRNLIYVSSAKKAVDFAVSLSQTNFTLDECSQEDKNEIEKVAKLIEQKIHEEYFLANLIRKRIAYHIGALPAEIRSKIESLIRKGIIKYCFCTSTLLEGVNVPVDNLFVFDNKKASSKMSEIDAFNLMGRAGRVTLNEFGNVFLFVDSVETKKYYDDVLLKPLPHQSLLPSKALKKSIKKYIVEVLLSGRTNLLLPGEKYDDHGLTEVTFEYASKCLNMLLHDLCSQNDSFIVRDFRKDKVLTPQNIIDIRNKFGTIVSKDDDINLSARQKESLYIAVKERKLNYPETFEYDVCLRFLSQLSSILRWDIYEKNTLGRGESIRYYTVILTQWMQGKGLHEVIKGVINYYEKNSGQLISYTPFYHLEPYNGSQQHKNQIINDVMKDIDHIINYKFSMYFLRLSEAIIELYGKEALSHDWYEYVEYGTCNNAVILMQKFGFLREEALQLLKIPYSDFIVVETQFIYIKKSIFNIVSDDLRESMKTVMINYPEIFIE